LHSRLDGGGVAGGRILPSTFDDTQPRWFITHTPYGLQLAAQRNAGPKKFQWRVNQFLMPYLVQIATPAGVPILTQIRTPIDDYRSLHFRFWSMPERPLNDVEMAMIHDAVTVPEMIPGTFLMKENLENEYLLDRDAQRSASFTGIKSFVAQDLAVTQDQGGYGTIADRSREYLTSSDKAIIAWRKRNITAAKELARGVEPSEPRTPAAYNVRPGDFVLGRDIALEDRGGQLLGSAL
jgi:phthalate 4,5-dioxygenase oxygenase subunit